MAVNPSLLSQDNLQYSQGDVLLLPLSVRQCLKFQLVFS